MYYRYFAIFSPWEKNRPFIWAKLNEALCKVLFEFAKCFWKKKIFQFCQHIFVISLISSLGPCLKKKNLNYFNIKMLCADQVWMKLVLENKMKMFREVKHSGIAILILEFHCWIRVICSIFIYGAPVWWINYRYIKIDLTGCHDTCISHFFCRRFFNQNIFNTAILLVKPSCKKCLFTFYGHGI